MPVRMFSALAEIAGWIARNLKILRGTLATFCFCLRIFSCGAFSMFHWLLDFTKHRVSGAVVFIFAVYFRPQLQF